MIDLCLIHCALTLQINYVLTNKSLYTYSLKINYDCILNDNKKYIYGLPGIEYRMTTMTTSLSVADIVTLFYDENSITVIPVL